MQIVFRALAAAALVGCFLPGCARTAPPPRSSSAVVASALRVEGEGASAYLRAGESSMQYARITVSAPRNERAARPPINLALLVDTSGSMDGKPIADARAASAAVIDQLAPDDVLSVIVFHSKAEKILPATRVGDADVVAVKNRIKAMRAEGTTDMAEGLALAIAEVESNFKKEGVNRVILLGDGVPNDEVRVMPMVQSARARGVSVTALGLGADYNETLMGQIAQISGGRFHYVADSAKVASFFKDEIVRMQTVVAKNARLELIPGPGVRVEGVVGQPAQTVGGRIVLPLGDISVGDARELVVKVACPPQKDGAAVELFDAVLRFDDPGALGERRVFIGARATKDLPSLDAGKRPAVEQAVARALAAEKVLQQIKDDRANADRDTKKHAPGPTKPGGGPAAVQGAVVPRPAPAAKSAEEVRAAHDDALRTLQQM